MFTEEPWCNPRSARRPAQTLAAKKPHLFARSRQRSSRPRGESTPAPGLRELPLNKFFWKGRARGVFVFVSGWRRRSLKRVCSLKQNDSNTPSIRHRRVEACCRDENVVNTAEKDLEHITSNGGIVANGESICDCIYEYFGGKTGLEPIKKQCPGKRRQ